MIYLLTAAVLLTSEDDHIVGKKGEYHIISPLSDKEKACCESIELDIEKKYSLSAVILKECSIHQGAKLSITEPDLFLKNGGARGTKKVVTISANGLKFTSVKYEEETAAVAEEGERSRRTTSNFGKCVCFLKLTFEHEHAPCDKGVGRIQYGELNIALMQKYTIVKNQNEALVQKYVGDRRAGIIGVRHSKVTCY